MEKEDVYFLEGRPEELCRDLVATRDEFDRSIAELRRTNAATISKNQGLVKIVSRRILKRVNLTEYNRLKKEESRSRLNVKSKSKAPSKNKSIREEEIKKEKNKERAPKPPPLALVETPEPKGETKPADPRRVHPAILGVWEVTGKYPPKELWDEMIERMGEEIDTVKLKRCWIQWRARGYKPTNFAWALEWYNDGIPDTGQNNGTNRKYSGGNAKQTPGEIIANRPYRRQ
jgi:hypothetical protein